MLCNIIDLLFSKESQHRKFKREFCFILCSVEYWEDVKKKSIGKSMKWLEATVMCYPSGAEETHGKSQDRWFHE
jgi:hypothetical protein